MTYALSILRRAQKELAHLPPDDYGRVRDAIRSLAEEPRPRGSQKLAGREGWRIRVGPYRVIYEVDDRQRSVTILHVGHRRDVYREASRT
jgi:mRNA interferase RelE/StbE